MTADRWLKVRTVPAGDPTDLLARLHGPGPLAWVRRGDGLVGWGEAATIIIPAGPDQFAAERTLRALFDGADTEDHVGLPGCGPVAFGSFIRARTHARGRKLLRVVPCSWQATADAAEQVAFSPGPRLVAGSPEPDKGQLSRLARRHLGQAGAERWLRLLRPAVRLIRAEPGDPVVAQLGGLPALPINSWPVWPGHGPLSHVLTIDCASLAALMPGWDMADSGRLAFFYFDGLPYVHRERSGVGSWDLATQEGARVLWLHPEESTPTDLTHVATPASPGLTPFPRRGPYRSPGPELAGRARPEAQADLGHCWSGPASIRMGAAARGGITLRSTARQEGRKARPPGGRPPRSGAAGGSVQLEADKIERALRGAGDPGDRWRLLAQVDSDDAAKMMWGDVGKLYFMIRPDDLQARRFDKARFTWQCS